MANSFRAHKVYLSSADFQILVLEYPDEDEINERLVDLALEKGLIYRHLYEDFVIMASLVAAGPFFYHIRRRPELLAKYADIRKELLAVLYTRNPGFEPNNIVINSNNHLKTRSTTKPGENVRPLIGNELWNQDPPLSNFGPALITNAPKPRDNDMLPLFDDDPEIPPVPVDNPFENTIGSGDNVPYTLVGHRWETAGLSINVRQYEDSEEARVNLLGGTPFNSKKGYHLVIVQLCIEDFSDVFHLLDETGITEKHTPEKLVEELYEIGIIYNSFLKLEGLNLKEIRQKYKELNKDRNRASQTAAASAGYGKTKRKGKKFSDLTEEQLFELPSELKKKIVGQDEAMDTIADAILRASVGLKREHEPLGVFMFTGNTGVGKTEASKVLASCLGAHLARIDCQEYQQPHEVAKLSGSPAGYIGYDDGGHLTKEVSEYPFSVVLFDEIEKAHSNFHERVLQIIDDGILTEAKGGKKVSFNETIIIMTSNIGVKEVESISRQVGIGSVSQKTDEKMAKERASALKKKFKPEFLNRVDDIIHFSTLDNKEYECILDLLLSEVQEQIKKSRGLALYFNKGAKNYLLDNGIDKKFGARPLRRAIKKHLNTPLARAILRKEIDEKSKVVVSLKPSKDGLTFRSEVRKVAHD